MLMAYGYMRRLFEVFERHRTPVDVVSTSEVSVSVTIDDRTHLESIVAALSTFAEVSVSHHLALVAVVGDRYGADPMAFSRVVKALQGLPLRLVSQADARRNVTLVLDEDDLPRGHAPAPCRILSPRRANPCYAYDQRWQRVIALWICDSSKFSRRWPRPGRLPGPAAACTSRSRRFHARSCCSRPS